MTTQLDTIVENFLNLRLNGVTEQNTKRSIEGLSSNREFTNKILRIVELQYNNFK